MTDIYARNFRKLAKLGIVDIVHDLLDSENDGYARLKSAGFMDLVIDPIAKDGRWLIFSMAHYYKQNGDRVPDPDMVVRIDPDAGMADVQNYHDSFGFRQVYHRIDGHTLIDITAKRELNAFLGKWLTNLKRQGFDGKKDRAGVA